MKRKLRTRFNLMLPNPKEHVTSRQADQKSHHDLRSRARSFASGTRVMARMYVGSDKWIPGIILQQFGPVTYSVEIANGRVVKRHVNQLRPFNVELVVPDTTISDTALDNQSYPAVEPAPVTSTEQTERRYPQREHRPPDRYQPN